MLALRKIKTEEFYGGAIAVANHVSNFCKSIKLCTMIGENKEYKKKIINNTSKNIVKTFFYKKNSPTIIKKRFVDHINKNKILGVYEINDELIDANNQIKIEGEIPDLIVKVDELKIILAIRNLLDNAV